MDRDMVCGGSRLSGWDSQGWESRLTDCISLTQGRLKSKLNNWWKGKSWTKTHEISRRRRHMSWNSPEGIVLMGGEMNLEIARIRPNIKEFSDIPDIPDAIIPFYGRDYDYTRYGPFYLETTNEYIDALFLVRSSRNVCSFVCLVQTCLSRTVNPHLSRLERNQRTQRAIRE